MDGDSMQRSLPKKGSSLFSREPQRTSWTLHSEVSWFTKIATKVEVFIFTVWQRASGPRKPHALRSSLSPHNLFQGEKHILLLLYVSIHIDHEGKEGRSQKNQIAQALQPQALPGVDQR